MRDRVAAGRSDDALDAARAGCDWARRHQIALVLRAHIDLEAAGAAVGRRAAGARRSSLNGQPGRQPSERAGDSLLADGIGQHPRDGCAGAALASDRDRAVAQIQFARPARLWGRSAARASRCNARPAGGKMPALAPAEGRGAVDGDIRGEVMRALVQALTSLSVHRVTRSRYDLRGEVPRSKLPAL